MSHAPLGVGVIGCGVISETYLKNSNRFLNLNFRAVADMDAQAAVKRGGEFGLPSMTPELLLSRDDIDIVLNLTPPSAHADVSLAALKAGKHVYSEKPLCGTTTDARRVLQAAEAANLRVGCAPDTFLCRSFQAARAALDSGKIGRCVAGTATLMLPGHEAWHPNPDLYYSATGEGPLMDMGPYYLTWLAALLGPVKRVTGLSAASSDTRVIATGPRAGQQISVETPTHIAALLEFDQGAIVQIVTSFDVQAHRHPPLEIYGTKGSLSLPDPNHFDGVSECFFDGAWTAETAAPGPNKDDWRGIGLADMASAISARTEHRANSTLAFHVLDIIESIIAAAKNGSFRELTSTCTRPDPMDAQPLKVSS